MTFQNLRPLPMRITQRQYDRLVAHRARDHIAIQEHVRRALDNYLELLDRKAVRELPLSDEAPSDASSVLESPPSPPPQKSGTVPAVKPKSGQPRLVYR